MGFNGEYRPLVGQRFFLLLVMGVLLCEPALAQAQRETTNENVRRRQAERQQQHSPYWEGFILKHQGNCTEAIEKLKPLADRGFGFEDAQTALGECYLQLAGLDVTGALPPTAKKHLKSKNSKPRWNGLVRPRAPDILARKPLWYRSTPPVSAPMTILLRAQNGRIYI